MTMLKAAGQAKSEKRLFAGYDFSEVSACLRQSRLVTRPIERRVRAIEGATLAECGCTTAVMVEVWRQLQT